MNALRFSYKYSLLLLCSLGIACLVFVCLKNRTVDKDYIAKYRIDEIKYLQEYLCNGGVYKSTVCVDSFNTLYRSLIAYKLSDTNLIFVSFYKEDFLLYITRDSISIYKYYFGNKFENLFCKVHDALDLKIANVDSAINIISKEMSIVYLCKISGYYAKLLAFNQEANAFYILDYNRNQWYTFPFYHVADIRNTYLRLGDVKFVNSELFDADSLKYINPNFSELIKMAPRFSAPNRVRCK